MSGGWISGVCYPALVFVTALTGFRYIFVRLPWQRTYLAIIRPSSAQSAKASSSTPTIGGTSG